MEIYRWDIKQQSGFLTPWHSDTLFGSLCWAIADKEGENCLKGLLHLCRTGRPPFVVSDGFPAGFLPMPAGGMFTVHIPDHASKEQRLAAQREAKNKKRLQYLPVGIFKEVLLGNSISFVDVEKPKVVIEAIEHNTIDRSTGTSKDGGLFREMAYWYNELEVYMLIDTEWLSIIDKAMMVLEARGFGAGVSHGAGSFKTDSFGRFSGFSYPESTNAFITLSHCAPTAEMPTDAQYRVNVAYGKLGLERAAEGNPFKRPILMLEPGAVFWGDMPTEMWCGRLVEDVHSYYRDVVQCGISIALPCNLARPKQGVTEFALHD